MQGQPHGAYLPDEIGRPLTYQQAGRFCRRRSLKLYGGSWVGNETILYQHLFCHHLDSILDEI